MKNQAMLIDAFVKVHEKHPDYILQFLVGIPVTEPKKS